MTISELKMQSHLCETKKYRILTALDDRTCDKCRPFDDRVFSVAKAVVGKNYPPFHDGCRCAVALEL